MSNPTGDALVAAGIKDTQKLYDRAMYRPFDYDKKWERTKTIRYLSDAGYIVLTVAILGAAFLIF